MALVRVYCGLASTPPDDTRTVATTTLTVAVVDDAGRLLDVCDISDDPAGYAELGTLLAGRSGGTAAVAVAADTDEHHVTLLLAAAGRLLAIADDESLDDYAERFGDDDSPDEVEAPISERRAIGLARALQAGALAAAAQAAPRELVALKPILAAHGALATGRQGAAVALREVLRELYPAALRAYPDPAEPIPLAILDALPEPGVLSPGNANRSRDNAIAAELAGTGLADQKTIAEAITALRVAIAETPRRAGIGKSLTTAVAETIRQSVAAVRACDTGIAALVGLLSEKASTPASTGRTLPPRGQPGPAATPGGPPAMPGGPAAMPGAAANLRPIRGPEQPAGPVRTGAPRRPRVQPAAAASEPARAEAGTGSAPAQHAANLPPAAAHPGPNHAAPSHALPSAAYPAVSPSSYQPQPMNPPPASAPPAATPAGPVNQGRPVPPAGEDRWSEPGAAVTPPPDPANPPYGQPGYGYPPAASTAPRPAPDVAAPGSRDDWPLTSNATSEHARVPVSDPTAYPPTTLPPTVLERRGAEPIPAPHPRDGRVTPPWQADDLPSEPPVLRLVEPAPLADRALRDERNRDPLAGFDPLGGDNLAGSPSLQLVDSGPTGTPLGGDWSRDRAHRPESENTGSSRVVPPFSAPPEVVGEQDDDLLIFAEARSAWFSHTSENALLSFENQPADLGWQAARRAAISPVLGDATEAGLPRRVPQANLVPGSPLPRAASERPLHIVRDPAAMAAHTTGYFRGSRRGEEVRGFAVGGRPGREAAGGWDFSRDGWETESEGDTDRGYEFRPAAQR